MNVTNAILFPRGLTVNTNSNELVGNGLLGEISDPRVNK